MPELPDVENYRRCLETGARGKTIRRIAVAETRLLRGISARGLEHALGGRRLGRTRRHGKHLLAQLDDGRWLALHFGMTGQLVYFEDPEDDPAYDRMRLDFRGGGHLACVSRRLLGEIRLVDDADAFVTGRRLGPGAAELDLKRFRTLMAGRRGELKAALMDQRLLAGIGNVYSDEILFQARLHPRARVQDLGRREVAALHAALRRVLKVAIEKGAGYGDPPARLPPGYLLPRRRPGAACPRCGGPVGRLAAAGRTAYCCPRCQSC